MDIREFLLARVAEDEAILEEYRGIATHYAMHKDFGFGGMDDYFQVPMGYGRALAECAAKREIVEHWAVDETLVRLLNTLAAVYADHPDYQDEWSLNSSQG